jgi:hypothetical protein
MREANHWIEEKNRNEGDPLLRLEYEMMWPAVEALLREARDLIDGDGTARKKEA